MIDLQELEDEAKNKIKYDLLTDKNKFFEIISKHLYVPLNEIERELKKLQEKENTTKSKAYEPKINELQRMLNKENGAYYSIATQFYYHFKSLEDRPIKKIRTMQKNKYEKSIKKINEIIELIKNEEYSDDTIKQLNNIKDNGLIFLNNYNSSLSITDFKKSVLNALSYTLKKKKGKNAINEIYKELQTLQCP